MSTPQVYPRPGGASAPRKWSANTLLAADVAPCEAQFWQHVTPGTPNECWEWTGHRFHKYGQMRIGYGRTGSRKVYAHRASWVLRTGQDLPANMSIDHLCSNPPCVNPAHLEPVTIHENRRRARGRSGSSAQVERRVQELLIAADVSNIRHPRGIVRRICPLCGQSYGTDYLADHLRRHIAGGTRYRPRRVPPRDASEEGWDPLTCPECDKRLAGHLRRHLARVHGGDV